MPRATIGAGMALSILALGSYLGTGMASITALIPAFFGIPLILLGWLAAKNQRRKVMMHLAAALGALGFLAPLGRIIPALGAFEMSVAMAANIGMALICGVYLILSVRSFVDARRAQTVSA